MIEIKIFMIYNVARQISGIETESENIRFRFSGEPRKAGNRNLGKET